MIRITLNGQPAEFAAPMSIAELLQSRQLAGRRLAVERNGEIVPRSRHEHTPVEDGDALEIVVAVGGG